MGEIRVAAVFIIGVIAEGWLNGVLLPLFIYTMYIEFIKARIGLYFDKYHFCCLVYIFLSITARWILNVYRRYKSVLSTAGGDAIDQFSLDYRNPTVPAASMLLYTDLLVGDCIMIGRLYYVYLKSIRVCLPTIVSTIGMFVCMVALGIQSGRVDIFMSPPWVTAILTASCFNNIYCTGFIVTRLYEGHRSALLLGPLSYSRSLLQVMEGFIESVAPWTILMIVTYATFLARSVTMEFFSELIPPTIGISLCLIIIRSSANPITNPERTSQEDSHDTSQNNGPIEFRLEALSNVSSAGQDSTRPSVDSSGRRYSKPATSEV